MAGKVQMIYIDPPYGIRYGSNFQPFVNRREVKDGKDEDLTQEPETLKAFRDTWELGIHSYLTYLRDRLLLARELLHESGSVFVQISDENVHHVREMMDEIFGVACRVVDIVVKKKGSQKSTLIDPVNDYLLWYGKVPRSTGGIKFRSLFEPREIDSETIGEFRTIELNDGTQSHVAKSPTPDGDVFDYRLSPKRLFLDYPDARLFRAWPITNGGERSNQMDPVEFDGKSFSPPNGRCWSFRSRPAEGETTTPMDRLRIAGRLCASRSALDGKRYLDDFPYKTISNWWDGLGGASSPLYVVQTNEQIIARCLLMTTDPGDIVLDPTCGSGTTAFVAETWGRRWITCDTSRVALTLAKQRLLTSVFEYFVLAHPKEGVGSGFKYKSVPYVKLQSIANNPEIVEGMTREQIDAAIKKYADQETLYDQPEVDRSKARVTGPFTYEAVPAISVRPIDNADSIGPIADPMPADLSITRSGVTSRQDEWRDELARTGVRGKGGAKLEFARMEPLPGTRYLHAIGETKDTQARTVAVSFGPEFAPLEQRHVELAWEEARALTPRPEVLLFAAFHFDPEAARDIDELDPKKAGMQFLKLQMNTDLLTDDLKKKRSSNESFWLVGQPDVRVESGLWLVDSKGGHWGSFDVVAKLSGLDRLAEVNDLGRDDLSTFIAIAERRDLWDALPRNSPGFPGRIGDTLDFVRQIELLSAAERRNRIKRLRGDQQITGRAGEITAALKAPLTTVNYSQATVHGFDYYNPTNGNIESGDTSRIAMWLLDTDYDGRSLLPRQVFFPMSGEKDGWSRLAKNLKAEIDEELIEAYRGTVSLPFELGKNRRIAVKIIDDRGIECLKIIVVEK